MKTKIPVINKYLFTTYAYKMIPSLMQAHQEEVWAINDRRFNNQLAQVKIEHSDGSKIKAKFAFIKYARMERKGASALHSDILLIYPEHFSPMYFSLDDLRKISTVTFDGKKEIILFNKDN